MMNVMDSPPRTFSISAMLRADAYPHAVEPIELRETHISWVLLTGEYAYKIKKPVDFGFLDFSTLEKRRFFCAEEVRLNRRLAPDLYLDVVPVCGDPATPRIDGQGEILEYAVRMRQFDPHQEFDELLQSGQLTLLHMDATAKVLAGFHADIRVAGANTCYGEPAAILEPVQENFDQISPQLSRQIHNAESREQFEFLHAWSCSWFEQLHAVFVTRKASGHVRECHGDLHLRNIVYWQDKIIPFDCIEFNANLRWIDIMSELAFLLMDLDDHQRQDLAQRLLDSYLQITGDYDGLQVLRFYQVYRAMVRAKVASLRLAQLPKFDKVAAQELVNYLQLAYRYTPHPQPKLLITHGLSGSGKTYVTQQLLEKSAIIRLRSDVERKRLHGLATQAQTHSGIAQGIYSHQASELTYQHLLATTARLLSWGFNVVVDGAFLHQHQRAQFQALAQQAVIPFRILHCEAPIELQKLRLLARAQQANDASEANTTVLQQQLQTHEPLSDQEQHVCFSMDTTTQPDLAAVLDWLASA